MLKSNLKKCMKQADIPDMTTLIKLSGICRNTVRKLYRDENIETLKLETLIQFCNTLHCNLSDLVEYEYEGKTDAP